MDHTGINKLAGVLHEKMTETSEPSVNLDFGEIQDDYSLKTNSFPVPIPAKDYLICRGAAHKEAVLTKTRSNEDVMIPSTMTAVKPGDRVLVGWVGNDVTVIDIILPADEVI